VSKEPDKCIQRGIQEDQQPPEQYESDQNYKDSLRFAHTSIPRTYEGSYNSHLFQLQRNWAVNNAFLDHPRSSAQRRQISWAKHYNKHRKHYNHL